MIKKLKNSSIQEGIFLIIFAALIINESLKYTKFSSWALSPALFPIMISCFIIVLATSLIINGIKEEDSKPKGTLIDKWKNPILVLALTIIYLILLPIFHFVTSTIIYLISLLLVLGEKKWYTIALISITTTMIIYVMFDLLLSVRLP